MKQFTPEELAQAQRQINSERGKKSWKARLKKYGKKKLLEMMKTAGKTKKRVIHS